jgi:hypothetical protein
LRNNYEKISEQIDQINAGLGTQLEAASGIKEEQEKIVRANAEQLVIAVQRLKVEQAILDTLIAQREAAETEEEQDAITEQIANQKAKTDALSSAVQGYKDAIIRANNEIENQNEIIEDTTEKQKEVAKTAPGAKEKAQIADNNKAWQDRIGTLTQVNARMEQLASLSEGVIQGVVDIRGMFQSGRGAEGAIAAADLTKKIGQALLSTGAGPLAIAGGVLLGAGIIAGAVAKIVQAVQGREQSTQEIAEARLATIERQNDSIRAQMTLMDDLVALGDASLDTARERLAVLEKQRAEFLKEAGLRNKSQEQLLEEKKLLQDRVDLSEEYVNELEKAKDFSNEAQRELIEDINDEFGFKFDFGRNVTKSDIDEVINEINTLVAEGKADISDLELLAEINENILNEQLAILDERLSSAQFKVEVATILGDTDQFLTGQEDALQVMKERFQTALDDAGVLDVVGNISEMSAEDLKNINFDELFDGMEVPQSVIDSWTEVISTIDSTIEDQMAFLDAQEEGFDLQKELVNAKERAAKISSEEADSNIAKILEEQLEFLLEQEKILGESTELTIRILNLQGEINDLKQEGNEVDEESNEILMQSIRLRQQQIEQFRRAQEGAPLTSEQQRALDATDEEIRQQLEATGMTPTQIEEFMKSLPAFEKGGLVPDTGLAVVHKGELVIPANMVKDIEDQIQSFSSIVGGKNAIANGTDQLTNDFTRIILDKEAQEVNNMINISFGDIINNIPQGVKEPEQIVEAINKNVSTAILGTVQRAIDQNKLDFRGKRI